MIWVKRGAVGGSGGPPRGQHLLEGEGGAVIDGREIDDDQPGFPQVYFVDRLMSGTTR